MTIPRRDVTLDGIPLKWHTNLSDKQIASLYWQIKDDLDITQPSASVNVTGFLNISLHVFDKFVEFEDGACHCVGVNDTIYAIYKNTQDWEFWANSRALRIDVHIQPLLDGVAELAQNAPSTKIDPGKQLAGRFPDRAVKSERHREPWRRWPWLR